MTDFASLRRTLRAVAQRVRAESAFAYYSYGRRHILAAHTPPQNPAALVDALPNTTAPCLWTPPVPYGSALVFPALVEGESVGGVVLLRGAPFTPDDLTAADAALAVRLVEHAAMTERLSIFRQIAGQSGRAVLLEALTADLRDGLLLVMRGGHIMTLNRRFRQFFGLEDVPHEGMTLPMLLELMRLPVSAREALAQAWLRDEQVHLEAPEQHGTLRLTNAQGESLMLEWRARPVSYQERPVARAFIVHDLTPEHEAERLRAAFIQRITHELRTPLTSISGFAQFLLQLEPEELPRSAGDYLGIIHQSATHLSRLINDMIELARADLGDLELHLSDAHLPALLSSVAARAQGECAQRGLTLAFEAGEPLPHVRLDVDRITKVMTRLLDNALAFARQHIAISAHYLPDWSHLPDSAPLETRVPCVLVQVLDDGKGISADDSPHVFLPFYRGSSVQAGAGLGLTIAHSLVRLHGGEMWVVPATRKRSGGLVMFTLPVS